MLFKFLRTALRRAMGLSGSRHQPQQLDCAPSSSTTTGPNPAPHGKSLRCLPKRGRHHVVHWDNLPQAIRMRILFLAACPASPPPSPSPSSNFSAVGDLLTAHSVSRDDLHFIAGLSTVSRSFSQDIRGVLDAVWTAPLILFGRDKTQMSEEERGTVLQHKVHQLLFWADVWMCYKAVDPNIPKSTFWRRSRCTIASEPIVKYSDLTTNFLIVHNLNRQMALIKKDFTKPWRNENHFLTPSVCERIRTEILNYNVGVEMLADTLAIWPVWSSSTSSSSSSSRSSSSTSGDGSAVVVPTACSCNGGLGGGGNSTSGVSGSFICRCLAGGGSTHISGGEEGFSNYSRGSSPHSSTNPPKRSAGALAYGLGFSQGQRSHHTSSSSYSAVMSGRLCCCIPAPGYCARVDVASPGRSSSSVGHRNDHHNHQRAAGGRVAPTMPLVPEIAPKEFRAAVLGAPGTPYAGGLFFLKCKLPSNYPFKAPRFRFLTPFHHPLVSSRGEVHVDDMGEMWTPGYDLRTYLVNLMAHLYDMDPGFVKRRCLLRTPPRRCNRLVAEAFCQRPETFKENARQHTRNHAVYDNRDAFDFDKMLYRATAPKLRVVRHLWRGRYEIDDWTASVCAEAASAASAAAAGALGRVKATTSAAGDTSIVSSTNVEIPAPPSQVMAVSSVFSGIASSSAAVGMTSDAAGQARGGAETTLPAAPAVLNAPCTATESKIRVRIAQRIGGDSRVYKVSRKFTLRQIERKLRNRVRYGPVIRDTDAWVFAGAKMNADLTLPEAGVQDGDLVLRLAWH